MKINGRLAPSLLILAGILAGCGTGEGGVTVVAVTDEPTAYTPKFISTYSRTPTLTPTVTPTATKVPDLEIVDMRISDFSKSSGRVFFLGKIRNNTDTTMLLPSREYAFTFYIERYQSFGDIFWHDTWGPSGLMPGVFDDNVPQCNCILYPHEEGVIWFQWGYLDKLEVYSFNREELKKYDGPLGLTYTYSSKFTISPDLPTEYHPKAENVEFKVDNNVIYFEYDINVPAPKRDIKFEKGMVMGFLTLYDDKERILNILYANITYHLPWEHPYNNSVHLFGQSFGGDLSVNWHRVLDNTEVDLQQVVRIELLIETQYEGICFDKRHPESN